MWLTRQKSNQPNILLKGSDKHVTIRKSFASESNIVNTDLIGNLNSQNSNSIFERNNTINDQGLINTDRLPVKQTIDVNQEGITYTN